MNRITYGTNLDTVTMSGTWIFIMYTRIKITLISSSYFLLKSLQDFGSVSKVVGLRGNNYYVYKLWKKFDRNITQGDWQLIKREIMVIESYQLVFLPCLYIFAECKTIQIFKTMFRKEWVKYAKFRDSEHVQ